MTKPVLVIFFITCCLLTLIVVDKAVYQVEKNNRFCAENCHHKTRFDTFFNIRHFNNLAALHHENGVLCIDCHGGEGVVERSKVLYMAASNLVSYYTGMYDVTSKPVFSLGNRTCLKCHEKVFISSGKFLYFHDIHNKLKESCSTCHAAHIDSTEAKLFLLPEKILPVCNRCHPKMTAPTVKEMMRKSSERFTN